jgi:hypothetical protein
MTPEEVEAAIGLPPGNYYTRHRLYGGSSYPLVELLRESGLRYDELPFGVGERAGEGGRQIHVGIWAGNAYCIWVAFDAGGTAVGTYLLKVESGRDSALTCLLDGVRFRLGL